MGRKLIGLSVGFLLTVVLAFYLFPPQYDAIIRWLAPYLGPWLRFSFMFLFIIFGDFLSYTSILIIWVVVGIIAGLFARSYWGAIPVAIGVFGFTFLMMVIGFVAIILPLLLSGFGGIDPVAMFLAIPPDVSIFDILTAPVIGPVIEGILSSLGELIGGGGGGFDPLVIFSAINDAILLIILNAVKNFVVLLVAAIGGGAIGRAIRKPD